MAENRSQIILYQTEDGDTRIEVRFEDETVWLTQSQMAELFQSTVPNINLHIKNILEEGELSSDSTIKNYLIVQDEGPRRIKRNAKHYNLDMIISVGYRVRSHQGTRFRQWATERLREYLIKGFTMDDHRLKEGTTPADYFDELLERIRDIRASEKRFYKKITDIYKLSVDYEPMAEVTKEFFATVQNKLHWVIHGHTAAELIAERSDAQKPNMGLTAWKGVKLRRTDVTVAKNYLTEKELKALNRIITMYLDYAEEQAEQHRLMYMRDWVEKLNAFLQFNGREVLENPGKVSAEVAQQLALKEYEKFNSRRLMKEAEQPDTDFERVVKQLKGKKG